MAKLTRFNFYANVVSRESDLSLTLALHRADEGIPEDILLGLGHEVSFVFGLLFKIERIVITYNNPLVAAKIEGSFPNPLTQFEIQSLVEENGWVVSE